MLSIRNFALTMLVLAYSVPASSLEIKGFTPDLSLEYKSIDKNIDKTIGKNINKTRLKLHIFNPDDHKSSDKRPAIVFFFGGGWSGGSPSQFYPHAEYLASRGMVAIAAEYRVKSRNNTRPKHSLIDAKSAVRWIRQNADKLGINADKIAAGGGSAGGTELDGIVFGFKPTGLRSDLLHTTTDRCSCRIID